MRFEIHDEAGRKPAQKKEQKPLRHRTQVDIGLMTKNHNCLTKKIQNSKRAIERQRKSNRVMNTNLYSTVINLFR